MYLYIILLVYSFHWVHGMRFFLKKAKKRSTRKKMLYMYYMELRMYCRLTRYFSYMEKKINKFSDLTNKLSVLISFITVNSKPLYM